MFLIPTRASVFSYFPFIEDLFCILFSVYSLNRRTLLSTRGNKDASIFLNVCDLVFQVALILVGN